MTALLPVLLGSFLGIVNGENVQAMPQVRGVQENCTLGGSLQPAFMNVTTTADVEILRNAIDCDSGSLTVSWSGAHEVTEWIELGTSTTLTVVGADDEAAIDGLGSTRLFVLGVGSSLTLVDIEIRNGAVDGGNGGCIWAASDAEVLLGGKTSVTNCSATSGRGHGKGGYGGAVYAGEGASVNVTDEATITNCSAEKPRPGPLRGSGNQWEADINGCAAGCCYPEA